MLATHIQVTDAITSLATFFMSLCCYRELGTALIVRTISVMALIGEYRRELMMFGANLKDMQINVRRQCSAAISVPRFWILARPTIAASIMPP